VVVPHASEISFAFGAADGIRCEPGPECDLVNAVSPYWAAFGKTGDPNHEGAPAQWPALQAGGDVVLRLNTVPEGGIRVQTGLRKAQCDYFDGKRRNRAKSSNSTAV
jgi:carboxylesterase type B